MADEHPTKRCPKCDTTKPVSEFGISRSMADGRTNNCRQCLALYQRARALEHPRGTSFGLKALAKKAIAAERMVTEAKAAKRRVAAEHKALATEVLAPALAALKAAVSALETLMGPQAAPKTAAKPRVANGNRPAHPTVAVAPEAPPLIREIKTIVADERVTQNEAKRIQEREIVARAEWRPVVNTANS
jgi:hypothetical protein